MTTRYETNISNLFFRIPAITEVIFSECITVRDTECQTITLKNKKNKTFIIEVISNEEIGHTYNTEELTTTAIEDMYVYIKGYNM